MKQMLEKAVNRYLALDPESKNRLALLQDKTVKLDLMGISLTLKMKFSDEKIHFKDDLADTDLTIRGTPLNLLHMSLARDRRHTFFADDVIVEGNMELAHQVLAIFDELEIDWEEYLSHWVGDLPSHQMGKWWRGFKKLRTRIKNTLATHLNEYLHEEINLIPATEALQNFFQDVDELRLDVDRLEKRIEKLKEKL